MLRRPDRRKTSVGNILEVHSLELTWKWMWPRKEDHEMHYKQVVFHFHVSSRESIMTFKPLKLLNYTWNHVQRTRIWRRHPNYSNPPTRTISEVRLTRITSRQRKETTHPRMDVSRGCTLALTAEKQPGQNGARRRALGADRTWRGRIGVPRAEGKCDVY